MTYDLVSNSTKQDTHVFVVQYYHGNPDMSCPQNPVAGLPWYPVIWGDYILRIQATISTTSRVVDQVCALNCTVADSNPSMRPVRYREVCSSPLKYVWSSIFDPFLRLFLGCVPENPCPDIHGVPITECLVFHGTTVVCKKNIGTRYLQILAWERPEPKSVNSPPSPPRTLRRMESLSRSHATNILQIH